MLRSQQPLVCTPGDPEQQELQVDTLLLLADLHLQLGQAASR